MSEEAHNFIDSFDYIVVGSGAGGGTLAARLAEGGARVLVLEAGSDPKNPPPGHGHDRLALSQIRPPAR
ncbi:NAD(P)-binding protein [Novosphingobium sediminicola]|uniref:Choline dehydrogenase-like flavoprotein n=1 Tax=Novosphingobium sediminicola TaxID=563162 RepID=A0A7W6CBX5_9SPHN|nr:NAD(P)-binding protein [Novosphingobium sediminicola]MBB3953731.1 choline dehydrogenase-like flavoprotein [Novosphingobium sediminicola]